MAESIMIYKGIRPAIPVYGPGNQVYIAGGCCPDLVFIGCCSVFVGIAIGGYSLLNLFEYSIRQATLVI